MQVKFTHDYNHQVPGAVEAFKAGYEGAVKKEVGQAAIRKKRAVEVKPEKTGNGE